MPIVTAGRPGGADISTVRISDLVWAASEPLIRREAAARGMVLDVLSWEPPPSSQYAPERNCDDLAAVREWIGLLNARED